MDIRVTLRGIEDGVLDKARERLTVIYPDYAVSTTEVSIVVSGAEAGRSTPIRQTVLKQIIRAKEDAKRAPLRDLLSDKKGS